MPFDPVSELAVKVSNRGVQSPVHIQFRRIANLTITNTDTSNALTVNILSGKGYSTLQVSGGSSVIFKKQIIQSFYFSGNANTVFSYVCSYPQETDPNTLAEQTALAVTVSGTVSTADTTGIAAAVTNQWANFPNSRVPISAGGGAEVHEVGS